MCHGWCWGECRVAELASHVDQLHVGTCHCAYHVLVKVGSSWRLRGSFLVGYLAVVIL